MGAKGSKNTVNSLIVSGRVEQAIPDLQEDWAKVKGKPVNKINWKKTVINKKEFAQLMDASFTADEIDGLYQLYDPNHVRELKKFSIYFDRMALSHGQNTSVSFLLSLTELWKRESN